MNAPGNTKYLLFGGTFILANKLQAVGDKVVDGLSTKQFFVLRQMMDMQTEPPPTITQIATEMDSSRQNITKMLESLERQGYVTILENEADHRSRSVRMTEAGLQAAVRTADNAKDFLELLFEGIPDEELRVAGEVLVRMVGNLEKMQRLPAAKA